MKKLDQRYHLITGGRLTDIGGFLEPGQIMQHRGGTVVYVTCPKCAKMQWAPGKVSGHVDAPTIDRPMQCGGGYCTKCSIWFRIANGKAYEVDPPDTQKKPVSEKLRRAGVRRPPRVDVP